LEPPALPEGDPLVDLPPQLLKVNQHTSARIAVRRTLNIRRFLYFFKVR
jgi:hypothetical protein